MKQSQFALQAELVEELVGKLSKQAEVLNSTHPNWLQVLKSFNKDSEHQTPAIYVRCSEENDVVQCLKFAKANNMPLTPRSGGHNLGNFSLIQGGLVIDVKGLKKISHSQEQMTITYQTGCRFGQVDDYLFQKLPGHVFVGTMDPGIGTAGARGALGVGWLQRIIGNGIDNIISIKIALADGSVVTASQKQNKDLFYALRGAAANFGVMLQITQKIHNILDPLQREQVLYSAHFYKIQCAQQVYNNLHKHYGNKQFPNEIFILPVLAFFKGERGMILQSAHFKYNKQKKQINTSESQTEKILKAIQQEFKGQPINPFSEKEGWGYITYKALQKKDQNGQWGSAYYPFGGFVSYQNAKDVTSQLIKSWRESEVPQSGKQVLWHSTAFYHFGGKVQRQRNPKNTAWPGNAQTFILTATWGGWNNNQDKNTVISWVKNQWKDLYKKLQFGYLCAAAFDWKSKSYAKFIYDENYEELSKLKKKYDPDNVFRHVVNIEPYK